MKHLMFLLLISLSNCYADKEKIGNHLPMCPDNDLNAQTKENLSFLIDYIAFEQK